MGSRPSITVGILGECGTESSCPRDMDTEGFIWQHLQKLTGILEERGIPLLPPWASLTPGRECSGGREGPRGRHRCQMTDVWSECTQMVTVPGIWPHPPAPGSDVSATLTTSPFLHSSLDFYEREKETFHFLK